MSTISTWAIALSLAVAIGASWHLDEPDTETAEEIAAEQATAHRVEHAAQLVEFSAMWSPMR